MDAQAYLDALQAKLASSTIVSQIEIVQEYATPYRGFFRARLTLHNADFLEAAEFFRVMHGQTQTYCRSPARAKTSTCPVTNPSRTTPSTHLDSVSMND